jgi:hypothetical protein
MTNEKLIKVMGLMSSLLEQQAKAQDMVRQIVIAAAREHLKQNNVTLSVTDWEYTQAALMYLMGQSSRVPLYSRRYRPSHIRLFDLKPVVILDSGEGDFLVREFPRRKGVDRITGAELDEQFMLMEVDLDAGL